MNKNFFTIPAMGALAISLLCATSGVASESLPPGREIVALESHPSSVELKHQYDYCQMLITARLDNGDKLDVTRMVQADVEGGFAKVSPTGVVRPESNGSGAARFLLSGQSLIVPVKVSGQKDTYPVSFVRDVMPTMSKMGCNAGTCHGSLNGKNGFKLSLRGYDSLFDHRSLTDDISGRRFNRAAPDQSLMLLKPSGVIPHVGGVLTHPGEPYYELIRAWIANGVKLDLDATRVRSIELFPKDPVVPMPGMSQQMKVLATYADGAVRDVTLEAFVESGNTEVAENNKSGLIKMIRRGEAPMLARFEGCYTATTITVMGDRTGFVWSDPKPNNYVDELVYNKLKRVKTLPSELCNDAEFIRRVMLDLTGLPPTADEVRSFLADPRDTKVKRDELVDRLIGNGDYVEYWSNKWADLLQVNRKFLGEEGAFALRGWIKQAIASNMPYDKFVYTVLTASGSTMENPPAAYYKVLRNPEETMENTTQLFLAVRFNCNKCHDHPFERWTQGQYYHLAAYFAQVGRKRDPSSMRNIGGTNVEEPTPLIEAIYDSGQGEVLHGSTGKVAPPEFPYSHGDMAPSTASRREQLAKWITSPQNQHFSKSYVNRLWGYLFGRGIIEPIDDIRAGNPPTNPELLERMTQEFLASDFNMQEMLRTICKSRVYQQSIVTNKWNQDDEINFSHAIARRLPAEVLYDSLHRATGSVSRLPGVPPGYRAAQLPDSGLTLPSGFFEMFGRPARESACECERSTGMMLGPVMALVNGPTIAEAISDKDNALAKLVASERDDAKLVNELFMRVLCRPPTESEIAAGVAALRLEDNEPERLAAELAELEKQLDVKQAAWEADQVNLKWTAVVPTEMKSAVGASFTVEPDKSIFVDGPLNKDTYTITVKSDLKGINGFRLEALADPRLPAKGPGRSESGNFVIYELTVTATPKNDPSKTFSIPLTRSSADFSMEGYPVQFAIDGDAKTGWSVLPQVGKDHEALFEAGRNVDFDGGTVFTFVLHQTHGSAKHTLGKFRLSVTTSPKPVVLQRHPHAIQAIVVLPATKRTAEQKKALATYFRSMDARWPRLSQAVAATGQGRSKRLIGAQDLTWALINSPSFLFNR